MGDVIVLFIIIAIVTTAFTYIWREKKKGRKCIGCPYGGTSACHCKTK